MSTTTTTRLRQRATDQALLRADINLKILTALLLLLGPKALLQGMTDGINLFMNTVARKTGALRFALYRALINEVKRNYNKTTIVIHFPYTELNSPTYAKYHIINMALNPRFNRAGYKKPTTPGTKPVNPAECINLILQQITKQLDQLFGPYKIDWHNFITLAGVF